MSARMATLAQVSSRSMMMHATFLMYDDVIIDRDESSSQIRSLDELIELIIARPCVTLYTIISIT